MAEDRINNFTGGQTDRRLDGPSNFFRKAQNLYITENFKLARRQGFRPYNSTFPDPFGNQPIWSLHKHLTSQSALTAAEIEHILFIYSNGAFAQVPSNTAISFGSVPYLGNTPSLTNTDTPGQVQSYTRLNDDEIVFIAPSRPFKIFRRSSTDWRIVSLGLPIYEAGIGTPSATPDFAGGTSSYLYALVLKHQYTTLSGVTKIVRGSPYIFQAYTLGPTTLFPVGPNNPGITSPMNLSFSAFTSANLGNFEDTDGVDLSSTNSCFDYSNVVIEVYRTEDSGTIFRHVADVPSNLSSYSDTMLDATLSSRELLYTTGGVTPNDMSATGKLFGTFANNCFWAASRTTLYQSKAGIFDAMPGSYSTQPPQNHDIVGLSAIDVYPIMFTNKGVYRVEGIIDDLGNGSHRIRTISEKVKCFGHGGIVKAHDSIFFLAADGIYETDGFQAKKVSNHLNATYNRRVNAVFTNGLAATEHPYRMLRSVYDDENRRVWWFFPSSDETFDGYCESSVMLDMKYQHQDGYAIIFDAVRTEHPVTALEAHNGDLYIGTEAGWVLRQDQDYTSDVDPASTSNRVPIIYDYISTAMAFGTERIRKWFTKVIAHFRNLTDVTTTLMSDTDDSDDWREHKPIRERDYVGGINYVTRWFPKGRIRGTHKSFRFTNSVERALYRSADYDTATVAFLSGSWKATIDSGSWPGSTATIVNLNFRWSIDGYTASYPITAFSAATLTLSGVLSAEAGVDWEIWGVPMDEDFELDGYTVEFGTAGEAHVGATDEGTNAG